MWCYQCGRDLDAELFYKDKYRKTGRSGRCMECEKASKRKGFVKTKPIKCPDKERCSCGKTSKDGKIFKYKVTNSTGYMCQLCYIRHRGKKINEELYKERIKILDEQIRYERMVNFMCGGLYD